MKTYIRWNYENDNGHTVMTVETSGKTFEVMVAIGRLVQHYYNQVPEMFRPIFKISMTELLTDKESPVWEPENGTRIDLIAEKIWGGGSVIIKPMRPGDPCPCCGQPIKTRDPDLLYLLGWIKTTGFKPITYEQIKKLRERDGNG